MPKRSMELYDLTQESMSSHGGKRYKRSTSGGKRGRVSKVPRAIATRGTPDGYYEIPLHSYTKIYIDGNKGFFFTDQTISGAPNPSQPFGPGFGYSTSLDAEYFNVGDSASYSTIAKTKPNFAALQTVFDEMKIAEIKHEFWFAMNAATPMAAGVGSGAIQSWAVDMPELWLTVDPNNAEPFDNMNECVQYQKIKTLKAGRSVKLSYKPTIRYDVGADDQEAGTAVTLGATQASTYIQTAKPGCIHFGLRGFLNISNTVSNVAPKGYLHIKTTQICRFKKIT